MKKVTHLFLKPDSSHSFYLFSLLFGILLFASPASLSGQVTFTALDDLSVNASVQTGQSGGSPTGGVYSGPGTIDDGNGLTYTFNPAVAGVGVHTLTYAVGGNSATDDVEVLNLTPPSFSKFFDINNIGPGSVTTLTFTINNSASGDGVSDLNFTDNLPAGMTIATPANVTNSCGLGTVTAPDGGTTISYAGGALGAFSICTITVDVTSSTAGTHTNTTGDLNSSSGNSGTASANLTVSTNRPGFSKSFSPATVNFEERSTLTFTIDNSANASDMWSLNFTDNLPAGMEVASPPNISIGCSGGTFTAEPGSSVITYDYTNVPALVAGSTCTLSVDVVGTNASALNNVTGALTGQNSSFLFVNSGKASAALEVEAPTEIFLQKSFNPNPAAPGGTTNLEFTIFNFSRDFEATNITFTDDLTSVLAGLTATGTPINDVCGTGSVLSGTTNLTFTGGTIPPEGSCTFSVPLSVPANATGGIYTNTTSAIAGDLDGTTLTGNMANENLTIANVPTITKEFLNDPIIAGGTTTLEFTITNTDPSNPATGITFTDNIADFISGATVTSLPPAGTCGASSIFFSTLVLGDLVFQMNGGEIPAGGSCTFSIDVVIPSTVSSGMYNNTTSFLNSTIDGDIVLSNPASDDLEVLALPNLSKSFTDDPVNEGDIVNLEFEITYDDFATMDATGVSFTDDLNAVIPGLAAIGLPINDVCGVGSQISGTTNLSFTGGTMSPGDVCTFSVPVQVPAGTLPGSYTNTTSTLSATVAGQAGTSSAATDNLLIGGLTFTKEFIDDPVIPGDMTTLRFTIDNTTTFDYGITFFTDNLGAVIPGMAAVLPPLSNTCGMTLSGTTFVIATGGTVTAGTSCTIDVDVLVPPGTPSGSYNNITSTLSGTLDGSPVVLPPASGILEVNDNLIALSKTFTDDPVLPGGTVTVEYTLTNLDPSNAISNIAFTDDFDALLPGLQATGLPMAACGGTVSGTGVLSFTAGSLAAGATCTFSVTLQTPITAPYGGSLACPTSGITGEVNGFTVVGDPASDNLVFQVLQFSKSFAGNIEPGGSTTLTFTITNPDPINSVNAIRFTDDLDAVLSGMMATNLPLTGTCGPSSSVTGSSTITFNDGALAPGQSCTIDVIVKIPCGSVPGTYLNTTSAITATGFAGVLEGDAATDDITVLPLSLPSFTAPGDLCIDAGVQTGLGGGLPLPSTPTGGVYSGMGVTDDGNGMTYGFDPVTAGAGVHTITYTLTDENGCEGSAMDDVEVFDLPMVTYTALADLCIDEGVQTGLGGGLPLPSTLTGGVYSGIGVTDDGNGMTYSFDPVAAGAGVQTLTYTLTDANGCTDLAMDDVEVFEIPVVSFTAPMDICIDAGVQTGLAGGTLTGGVYSGAGVTDDGNGMTYSFDPAGAGAGVHTITYENSNINGCSASASDDVEVYDLPSVSFTALIDLCIDGGVQDAQAGGTPVGGVYSGPGVTDNSNGMDYDFDPVSAGVGVHTITYDYTDANGCMNTATDDVEVFDLPVVTFTALADLCIDGGVQAAQAGGTPTGGVYSGLGITDNGNGMDYDFDPAAAGVGVHTITYTYTDGNGCTNTASDDVEVFDLPVLEFTALADLCLDAGTQFNKSGGSPIGGTYSGPGVVDDNSANTYSFNPTTAGVGVHTITYSYTDGNGCSNTATDDVEVFALPVVEFTAPADLCIDGGVQASQAGGTPVGGVYSGPGVTDNGNGMDYDFDPAAAGVGVHTITYDYTDTNGCMNSATDDVEVFDLPVVTFTALADLCVDAGVQAGLGGGSPTGGVYSGPGVTDDGNGMTYSFDPAAAGVGIHTLTFDYTDGNGCMNSASDEVEVFDLPVVTFTALADLCVDAGVQAGLGGGSPTGGVYSGPGVTDDGNGMTYSFDPATAGVGVHTLTFDYTDGNGCINSESDDIEVYDLPSVSFTALADLCIDAGVQSGEGGGVPQGGVYSGTGVTDDGNGMTYSFDPSAAGVGVHTITYTYNDTNGCTGSFSDDVEVFGLPTVAFTALSDQCIDAGIQSNQSGGSPIGGTYSGPGVVDDNSANTYSFNPTTAGVGVHTITYTYTDGNGCTNSASDDVEVFDLPIVTFTALADLCIDAGVQAGVAGGTPTGGIYSGPGVIDNGNGMDYDFDPAAAGVGVHIITYDYTDANGCMNTASDDVEVFDLPTVSLSTAAGYCLDADIADIALVGGSPTGGVYSGTGVTDLGDGVSYNFDPMAAGAGTHTISYTLTDDNGCSNTATSDIEVYECGVDITDPCACLDNATIFDCNTNTGGDDGQFSELVTVTGAGGPLPIGQTWTVVGATGALDAFNVPAVGTQSAGVLIPSDGSVSLVYNNGTYEVPFVHVDDMGYTLMIEGPFGAGSPANVTLTISNICQYPDPVFDPAIPAMINAMDPVITLGAMDTNGGSEDGVTYTLDGNPTVEIDPSTLAMGTHTVTLTYDGADDGNGGVSPDGGTTAASPGCTQEVTKDFEVIVCMLEVDCSNVTDQTLACRADLPPVDFSLPMVTDSCGDVTRSALTIIPGNSGCPEDTVFITRTYFLQDQAGNMEECMQTFTVISTMDPTFTFFPGDTTVLCGASTDPSATGEATGTQECDFSMGDAVVTFSDVITPGSCPQEETITRTWTLTDACGRPVAMDQVIMVVDTIAPTMICQTATLELDENGMVTLTTADIDNGSNDNCGGDVTLSLSMEAFTCDNLGTNDVWLIGEDACGNIDSCMTVVTIEDNIAPTLTCPMDIVMDNDPDICGAIVTFDVIGDDNCDFTITQTEGIPSGEEYPVGETMNTYMIEDAAGTTAECSFLVTVNDVEGPVIDCPGDIIINLDAGECEGSVTYNIPFMDNCGSIDGEMSQAFNEMLINDALDCLNNTSNHLRYFENTQFVPLEISQVNFGIFNSGTMETVTVNVYMIGPGMAFEYGNMVLLGTTDQMIPAGTNNTLISAAVEATIPVGMNYVLELKANNTTNFVIGYNDAGESGSTYISGNDPVPCVSLEPVDVDVFGFGAFAVVLSSDAEAGPSIEQTAGLPQGGLFPIGTTTQTYVATDIFGNTTECTFDVIVNEFADVTGTMACNNSINVSLDLNCEVILNPDMLLEGGAYGCYDDYLINVSGGVGSGIITDPGTYTVTITDPDTGNSCWSTINVESKSEPVIDCTSVLCPIEMIEGEWTVSDATFSPGASWAFDGGAPNDDILYDVIKFVVETPGVYNLTMTNSEEFDGIAGLYVDSFDPLMPAENLVGGDDDIAGVIESEPDFMIDLAAGTYYLVSSTWGAGQMGVYGWSFAGPGDILSDCNVKCYELAALLSGELEVPSPEVTSCTEYELFYTDAVNDSDCGITTVTRTYLAENQNGSSSCEVVFEIEPISIDLDVDLPNNPVEMSCNAGTDPADIVAFFDNPLTKDNPNTSIIENNEGYAYAYPTYLVNGHPQKIDNQACNAYAGYTDQELAACGEGCNGNRKVIRTWTLVDWCTLETQTYIQTIKAVDTEAPTLNTADITVGTDAWGCEATFDVPAPWELHDNCDSNPGYTVSGPAGVTIEGSFETGYLVSGLGKGIHTFVYTAYDCCGNEANYPFTVTAIDNTPPVVVAKQNVVVSLTSAATGEDGYAKLYAESINNGSYDGCGDVHLEIRRDGAVGQNDCGVLGNNSYNDDNHPQDGSSNPNSPNYDPDGGAYVKFCCEDISASEVDVDGDGTNDVGYHKVWLRVWDDGDMNGVYGTSGDQYNEAWAYVKVEDKLPPAIVCPPDVTLTCDMDYTDLDVTGRASGYASCGGLEVEWNDIVNTLNTCNDMGFIRRRWNIVGRTDIFCDQRIDMTPLAGDDPVVRFTPQLNDKEVTGCPEDIELSENERPTWVAGPCDVLGYTVEADTFYFEDGACLKIVREWTVINWCDYDPNDNPNEGIWRHTQVVKVTDDTQPTIESCDDLMFEVNDHSDSDDDGNVCEAKITLTNIANDPGSANCPTGWLKWQVFVDLWGDGTYDYEYSSFLPTNDTNVNAPNDTNGNGIIDFYVMPTESGGTVSINLADIEGSMSNHKVDWKVTDGCNNVMTCSQNFMVVDKKAPTPYCIDISSAVMESSGTVELWAIDFNVGSFDNCTAEEALRYTFSEVAPEEDANYDATQRSSAMVFDCEDVENSPVEVNMYVWDEKGNADFCVVYLTLVDNSGACGDGMRVAGEVATESGVGVETVEVQLNAGLPEYPRVAMTDENGSYVFENTPLNVDYTITASKDIDYLNGVSTLDLVKIQRHILGLESLDSPYKMIAADINADDAIKANDLSQLRKLILGVITDLPTNESWRFVDGGQEMDMDLDLADVDYTTEITNLQSDMMNNDLVAVKVGDVTENATVNLTSENIEIRSNKTLELEIDNKSVKSGELVEVTFRSEDFREVYGYQFTLELNGLVISDVLSGAIEMREGNVGILSDRVVTVSYHNGTAKSASREEGLFTMLFTATKDGQLSEMIEMTSKVTPSEAYIGESLEIREVVISTRGEIVATAENNLYQNEPNPFKEQTTIGFELAEAGSVTMKVTDVAGKVLKVINTEGVRGMNYMTLEAEDFGVSGVLYYTIESGEFTDTKKMILVR